MYAASRLVISGPGVFFLIQTKLSHLNAKASEKVIQSSLPAIQSSYNGNLHSFPTITEK